MLTLVVPHDVDEVAADAGLPIDHADGAAAGAPTHDTHDVPGPCGALVEVAGTGAGDPLLAERCWLDRAVAATSVAGRDRAARPKVVAAHPRSGALVDPEGELSSDAYRPPMALAALVRARDGRCRFPGCQVAARFCDIDHVRPWPAGPTAATNLACLCRRHHRVKQRPGWRLVLADDAVATWTDPTGRTRTSAPVDAVHVLVLAGRPDEPATGPQPRGRLEFPDAPHSPLEFALEHRQDRRSPSPSRLRVDHHLCVTRTWEAGPGIARHGRRGPPSAREGDPPF
jgi:hypothetical protein